MRRTDAVPAQRVFAGCAVPVFILPQFICVISADNFEPEHFEQISVRGDHPIAVESLPVFLSGQGGWKSGKNSGNLPTNLLSCGLDPL